MSLPIKLLDRLTQAGITLKLTPAGGLAAGPARSLTDIHREAIAAHKDGLVELLRMRREAARVQAWLTERLAEPGLPEGPRRAFTWLHAHVERLALAGDREVWGAEEWARLVEARHAQRA